jgi:type IV pilus assembly protein PilW
MKPFISARHSRHNGFTLVEVMIALTIGMALTLVVSLLFMNSRRTYATTDDVSRMQENIRYTYQLLTRVVHLAGYKSAPNTLSDVVFGAGNEVLEAIEGAPAGTSDTLTVRFQGSSNGTSGVTDATIVDCLGNAVAAGVTATNVFSIGTTLTTTVPGLLCAVTDPATGILGAPVEVVPNVQNMQIRLGVDDNSDFVADRYVPPAGTIPMNRVRSIRFAFLFTSPTQSALLADNTKLDSEGNPAKYDLNGVPVDAGNDHFLRRAVTMTIGLRNRTP